MKEAVVMAEKEAVEVLAKVVALAEVMAVVGRRRQRWWP